MSVLATLTLGQLHAHTLHTLRKFHEVVTFPGEKLPRGSEEHSEWVLTWTLRDLAVKEVLAEWDRRLPLMREAVDIVKGGRP